MYEMNNAVILWL